ncbi:MAG: butyrate kinase [Firmicutes bacterium]|nr:butyrate kinase [Dethiobacter sp.]MBS3889320.1 butyrate kinase [Bacillota bacterium]MBS4055003.1 butyrate kinase [Thermaerobacter sp.]
MTKHFILSINPGSTSTKIALFENDSLLMEDNLSHSNEDLAPFKRIADQYSFRRQVIVNFLTDRGFDVAKLSAVVGRGGLLKPIASGTYAVNDAMVRDLHAAERGEHASNLGGLLAKDLADELGIPSFIVDPVVVDELQDVARLSGHPAITRRSIFHALNQKAVAKRYARAKGVDYKAINVIVAHLGGGVSVGAHCQGRVIDVNNALDGDGPFSPERSGSLPAGDLARLCYSGQYTLEQVKKMLTGQGGMVAYLGTNDGREVTRRMEAGDAQAGLVFKAFAYQVAKEIGAMAAALKGKVDVIILTGGLAHNSKYLVPWISEAVSFIAPLEIMPGEGEMSALCEGALRVIMGLEEARDYV